MRIINATIDTPDLLLHAMNQDGAVLNSTYNLNIIKATLSITPLRLEMLDSISSELRPIIKEYADHQIHNTALAHGWYNLANKHYNDALAFNQLVTRVFVGLTIINIILVIATGKLMLAKSDPYYLIPMTVFAGGALFFGLLTPQDNTHLPRLERDAAEQSAIEDSLITPEQRSLSEYYMRTVCTIFQEQVVPIEPTDEANHSIFRARSTSSFHFSTCKSSLFGLQSQPGRDDEDLEQANLGQYL